MAVIESSNMVLSAGAARRLDQEPQLIPLNVSNMVATQKRANAACGAVLSQKLNPDILMVQATEN